MSVLIVKVAFKIITSSALHIVQLVLRYYDSHSIREELKVQRGTGLVITK